MQNEFSPEVSAQLNYYVYRLIDPRNGQTFYVGKGRGNRIFQHVKCANGFYDENERDTLETNPVNCELFMKSNKKAWKLSTSSNAGI